MDIDLLSKMVKELILDNDEVTLPGVGTFVTEIIPSNFSDKGYTINPPYRRLYFRQKQNEQDTLLSDFYAKSNHIDKDTARLIMVDFLSEMKEILLHKRIIVFPGLGRLRATKENNLFFIADEELDIYPEGFGLEPVSLKTHQETTEEVADALDGLKTIMTGQLPVPDVAVTESLAEEMQETVQEASASDEITTETAAAAEQRPLEETGPEEKAGPAAVVEEEPAETVPVEEKPEIVDNSEIVDKSVENPVAAPAGEPEPVQPQPEAVGEKSRKGLRTAVWIIIGILILCILALSAFILASHLAPELIDKMLYSPEELELLRTR